MFNLFTVLSLCGSEGELLSQWTAFSSETEDSDQVTKPNQTTAADQPNQTQPADQLVEPAVPPPKPRKKSVTIMRFHC